MKAIITENNKTEIIENVCMIDHLNCYGINGNYECLRLWKDSEKPYRIVDLVNKTKVTLEE